MRFIQVEFNHDVESVLPSRTPKASRPPNGLGEGVALLPLNVGVASHDHLGDPLSPIDNERILAEVDEDHLDFATIVGIDGARTVQDGHAVLDGKSAAGTNLGFVTRWESDLESGRYEGTLAGKQ